MEMSSGESAMVVLIFGRRREEGREFKAILIVGSKSQPWLHGTLF